MATKELIGDVDIIELSKLVDRMPSTIRGWERDGVLPAELMPKRDNWGPYGRRRWTKAQVQGIIEWMKSSRRFPGGGLPWYEPTETQVEEQVHRMRTAKRAA